MPVIDENYTYHLHIAVHIRCSSMIIDHPIQNFDPLFLTSHEPLLNRSLPKGMYYHVLTAPPSTFAVFNKA